MNPKEIRAALKAENTELAKATLRYIGKLEGDIAVASAYSKLQTDQCNNPKSYYSGVNDDNGCKVTMSNITKVYYAAAGGEWQEMETKGRCDKEP